MSDVAGIIILVGRILFVIFPLYISGYSFHIRQPKAAEGYAKAMGFPAPGLAGTVAGLWLIVSSISIAVGIFPDIGALMLAAFVAAAAPYFHAFWKLEGEQRQNQSSLFWRNVMMFAACLIMFGFFASVGDALRFTVTPALLDLN